MKIKVIFKSFISKIRILLFAMFLFFISAGSYAVDVNDWSGFDSAYADIFVDSIVLQSDIAVGGNIGVGIGGIFNQITIDGGGHFLSGGGSYFGLISLLNIRNIVLKDIVLREFYAGSPNSGSGGAAVLAQDNNVAFEGSVDFLKNTAEDNGGAIYAISGTRGVYGVSFNEADVIFTSNTAQNGEGGAIGLNKAYLRFLAVAPGVKKSLFEFNTAVNGGALASLNSDISFENYIASFSFNFAENNGGAVYLMLASVFSMDNSLGDWTGNYARTYGGALYADETSIITLLNSTLLFAGNAAQSGGAWYLANSQSNLSNAVVATLNNSSLTFSFNIAEQNGGAIYADYANLSFNNSKIFFINNTAVNSNAGALYLNESLWAVSNSTVVFTNNSSILSGAAVYAVNSQLNFTNGADISLDSHAVGYGRYGAALYIQDSQWNIDGAYLSFTGNTANMGGALYLTGSNILNFANAYLKFSNNTSLWASGAGGAVFGAAGLDMKITSSAIIFESNTASYYGGAFYLADGAKAEFIGSTISFTGNTAAGYDGGAVYLENGSIFNLYGSSINFTGNSARFGAGIYALSNEINFNNSYLYFAGNTAAQGAAIYANSGSLLKITRSSALFTSNSSNYGAALFLVDAEIDFDSSSVSFVLNTSMGGAAIRANSANALIKFDNSTVSFILNTSSSTIGGAVSLGGGGQAVFNNSNIVFEKNVSEANSGGAIALNNALITLDYSSISFISNTAFNGGGALYIAGGGGFVLHYSTANFISNISLQQSGGAVFLQDGSTNFALNDSLVNFISNTANRSGGALYIGNSAAVSFSNSIVSFILNTAMLDYGGAIFTQSALNFNNSTVLFDLNTAALNGGAIWAVTPNALVNFYQTIASFTYNTASSGGAVFLNNTALMSFEGSNIYFASNTAVNGGAMYINNARADFENSIVRFTSNTASIGAAIYLNRGSVVFSQSDIYFYHNKSTSGDGIIYTGDSASLLTFDRISILEAVSNESLNGGFLAFVNYGSTETPVFDNVSYFYFSGNMATAAEGRGGVFYLAGSTIIFNASVGTASFNNAFRGGAIYLSNKSSFTMTDSGIIFYSNKASSEGASLFLDNSFAYFKANRQLDFTSNTAKSGGGAIYLLNFSSAVFDAEAKLNFYSNTASSGGAIFASSNSSATFSNSILSFTSNSAIYGGALAVQNSSVSFLNTTAIFFGNIASSGGAIYFLSASTIIFNASSIAFTSNTSTDSDGIINVSADGAFLDFTNIGSLDALWNNALNGGFLALIGNNLSFDQISKFNFSSNTATAANTGKGGALYLIGSTLAFNGSGIFTYNVSQSSGGAIYADFSSITFITSVNDIVFDKNTADGNFGNDVFLSSSSLLLKADGRQIAFKDGVYGFYGSSVNIMGSSEVYMSGINQFYKIAVFTATGGVQLKVDTASFKYLSNTSGLLVIGSTAVFNKSAVYFSSGSSNINAGLGINGIDDAKIFVEGSSVYFTSNTALSGGGVFVQNNTTISFANSFVNFSSNTAIESGGAFAVSSGAFADFNLSSISFLYNTSQDIGGAFYSSASITNVFNSTLSFSSNTANEGGALSAFYASSVSFSTSVILFRTNSASSGGAVNINQASRFSIFGSTALFNLNRGNVSGGAIYVSSLGKVFVENSYITLSSNIAVSGGALYADVSSISFARSTSVFLSNTASTGSAIYIDNGSTVTFENGNVFFRHNKSTGGDGAIYWKDGLLQFTNVNILEAVRNTALNGGFLAFTDKEFVLRANDLTITSNTAASGLGGAFYLNGATISFVGIGTFSYNRAMLSSGGFIYAKTSSVNFIANSADILMLRNTAVNNRGNDIYSDASTLNFIAYSNRKIELQKGGVYAVNKSTINVTGQGLVSFGGYDYFEGISSFGVINGGILRADGSTFNYRLNDKGIYIGASTLAFVNSSAAFIKNYSDISSGAAIFANASSISFSMTKALFSSNTASAGGAVFIQNNSLFSAYASSLTFLYNTAIANTILTSGGAVYINDASTISFSNFSTVSFGFNTAAQGGALFVSDRGQAQFSNSRISFSSNSASSGGAVYLAMSNNRISLISGNSAILNFNANSAQNGGAIENNSTITFTNSSALFEANKAVSSGGAVNMSGAASFFIANSTTVFRRNIANFGGAIALSADGNSNKYIYVSSGSSVSFISNTASSGGAIAVLSGLVKFDGPRADFILNRSTDGGAIYIDGAAGAIRYATGSTIVFSANRALLDGGALYSRNLNYMETEKSSVVFYSNIALRGGAVFADDRSSISFVNSKSYFIANTASSGAAVYVTGGATVTFKSSDVYFYNNRSTAGAGIVYWDLNSVFKFIGVNNLEAISNWAINGGFLAIVNRDFLLDAEHYIISSNTANTAGSGSNTRGGLGGAFYLSGGTITIRGDGQMVYNTAITSGGLIYAGGQSSVTIMADIGNIDFIGNRAVRGKGNDIYLTGSSTLNFNALLNNEINFKGGGIWGVERSVINSFGQGSVYMGGENYFSNISSFGVINGGLVGSRDGSITYTNNDKGIYVYRSSLSFITSTLNFIRNHNPSNPFNQTPISSGGAIFAADFSAVSFRDSILNFTSNTATFAGGAIYAFNTAKVLIESSGLFTRNFASSGGAIFVNSGAEVVLIAKGGVLSFVNNTASGQFGGEDIFVTSAVLTLQSYSDSRLEFRDSIVGSFGGSINVSGNFYGGGIGEIYLTSFDYFSGISSFGIVNQAYLKVENSTFIYTLNKENGIYAANSSTVFQNVLVLFTTNTATKGSSAGAAIYADLGSSFTFNQSMVIVSSNRAQSGGAFYITSNGSAVFNASAVIFASNTANSNGAAAYITDNGRMNFFNSTASFISNTAQNGGGVYIANNGQVNFSASSISFSSNNANYGGGVYVNNGQANFSASSISFSSNKANNYGGGVYITNNGQVNFSASSISFTSNNANDGGGFYIVNGQANFSASSISFNSNNADNGGGVYIANNGQANFNASTVSFSSNNAKYDGGAIVAVRGTVTFSNSNISFVFNTANASGGALAADYTGGSALVSVIKSEKSAIHFLFNTANWGGAIYASANGQVNINNSFVMVDLNSATIGGGIFAEEGAYISFDRSTILFTSNTAVRGGAIASDLNATNIYFQNSTVVFTSNIAQSQGGAAYIANTAIVHILYSTVHFLRNNASSGGAIALINRGAVNIQISTVKFTSNSATVDGGAIFASNADFSVYNFGFSSFVYNTAVSSGGAIYAEKNSRISIYADIAGGSRDILFKGNSALGGNTAGDAIYLTSSTLDLVSYSTASRILFYDSIVGVSGSSINVGAANAEGIVYLSSFDYFSGISSFGVIGGVKLQLEGSTFIYTLNKKGGIFVNRSTITFNSISAYFTTNTASQGAALYGNTGALIYIDNANIVFTSNTATASNSGGAAIYANGAEINFRTGARVVFASNTANLGGAVFAEGQNSYINFNNQNGYIVFTSNTAISSGGALYAKSDANISFNANSDVLFSYNKTMNANAGGGALYADGARVNFNNLSSVSFTSNTAVNGYGGGIYSDAGAIVDFRSGAKVFFTSNTANAGGAISVKSATVVFNRGANVFFVKNSASSGAAVYAQSNNSYINFNNVLYTVNFVSNTASFYGGAAYLENNAILNIKNSSIVFSSNAAGLNRSGAIRYGGGAIAASSASLSVENSTLFFAKNMADYGGVIYLMKGAKSSFTLSSATFIGNSAIIGGGVIYSSYQSLYVFDRSSIYFTSNSATRGGVIYADDGSSSITFVKSSVNFTSNSAIMGGSIYTSSTMNLDFNSSLASFTYNIAQASGGAIYMYGGELKTINSIVSFTSNTANYGGAIAMGGNINSALGISRLLVNGKITFSYNTAASSGGAIYAVENSSVGIAATNDDILFRGNKSLLGIGDDIFISSASLYLGAFNGREITLEDGIYGVFGSSIAVYGNSAVIVSSYNYFSRLASFRVIDGVLFNALNSTFVYIRNTAGISVLSSTAMWSASSATFVWNSASSGSAINVRNLDGAMKSWAIFSASSVSFTSNTASRNGGAVYGFNGYIKFERSSVNFTSNTAVNAGAGIFADAASSLTFANAKGFASYNVSFASRGVLSSSASYFSIEGSTIYFSFNRGASIYLEQSTFTAIASSLTFLKNNSDYGSGIKVINSTAVFGLDNEPLTKTSLFFTSNSAVGGAGIYISSANMEFYYANASFAYNTASSAAAFFSTASFSSALYSNFVFVRNSAQTGRGGAMGIIENSIAKFDYSTLLFSSNVSAGDGGAVAVSTRASLSFNNSQTSFAYNRSLAKGGAIGVNSSNLNFSNSTGIFFVSNSASSGGAISISADLYDFFYGQYIRSLATFDDTKVIFKNNTALQYGGGIYMSNSSIAFRNSQEILFENNVSTDDVNGEGGGAYIRDSAHFFVDSSIIKFIKNSASLSGGAITVLSNSRIIFQNSDIVFASNTVNGNGPQYGGAVLIYDYSILDFIDSKVLFIENRFTGDNLKFGGAIYSGQQSIVNFSNSDIVFTLHTADIGGAVYLYDSTMTFVNNSKVDFNKNNAADGGAIAANTAFIRSANSFIKFEQNISTPLSVGVVVVGAGGAVALTQNSRWIDENGTLTFERNNAFKGGALYADEESTAHFSMNSIINITNNSAKRGGGAYIDNSYINVSNSQFYAYGNKAISTLGPAMDLDGNDGGAFYTDRGAKMVFSASSVSFINNIASNTSSGRGGAIYSQAASSISFSRTKAIFLENRAGYGGAVYITSSSAFFDSSAIIFSSNIAQFNGGAIYASSAVLSFSASSASFLFTGNTAQLGGALYGDEGAKFIFREGEAEFIRNSSLAGDGIVYIRDDGSAVIFEDMKSLKALNNEAQNGGFLATGANVQNSFYISAKIFDISNNSAMAQDGKGGAFYLPTNSNFVLLGAGTIYNNIAPSSGGAFYMSGSSATIAAFGGDIVFRGNKSQKGYGDDIFLSMSKLHFNSSAELQIRLEDGIYAVEKSSISLFGSGKVYMKVEDYFAGISSFGIIGKTVLETEDGEFSYLDNDRGIYINNSSAVFNNRTAVSFINNIALNPASPNGAAINASSVSFILFNNASAEFSSNTALNRGGAISLVSGTISGFINSTINVSYSSASSGAFIGGYRSNILFDNVYAKFSLNFAGDGGVFFAGASTLSFKNSTVNFKENVAFLNGGVFYLLNSSSYSINNSIVEASYNTAGFFGGVIFADGKSNMSIRDSQVSFSSNTSNYMGGAIHLSSFASLSVNNSEVLFKNNISTFGGAISGIHGFNINMENSSLLFEQNYAVSSGGAVYLQGILGKGSAVSLIGKFTFIDNTADFSGGGIFISEDMSLTFGSKSNVIFTGNFADYGGAVFVSSVSRLNIYDGASINFERNSAKTDGGAIYADNDSLIVFRGSSVNFTSNSADPGGAIYLTSSSLSILNSRVIFTSNAADSGGAIFMGEGSNMSVGGSYLEFNYNNSSSGSAIYLGDLGGQIVTRQGTLRDSIAVFDSNVNTFAGAVYMGMNSKIDLRGLDILAINNTAHRGAFLYIKGDSAGISSSTIGDLEAIGNKSLAQGSNKGLGGAIYLEYADAYIGLDALKDVLFTSNTANSGGAIYVKNASVSLMANFANMIFKDNVSDDMNSKSNDIYMDINSSLYIAAMTGQRVEMYGGIKGISREFTPIGSNSGQIRKDGGGLLLLSGMTDFDGEFFIERGEVQLKPASVFPNTKLGFLTISAGSSFTIRSDGFNVYGVTINDGDLKGNLNLSLNVAKKTNDAISSTGTVSISSLTAALSVKVFGGIGEGRFVIINAQYGVNGKFREELTPYEKGNIFIVNYKPIIYEIDRVIIELNSRSNFTNTIAGLTNNQNEAAKVFDSMSESSKMGDFITALSMIAQDEFDLRDGKYSQTRRIFDKVSGGFLAQVLPLGAQDYNEAILYSKVRELEAKDNKKRTDSIWVEGDFGGFSFDPKGVLETVDGSAVGFTAGRPLYKALNTLGGLFLSFRSKSIEQGADNADIIDISAGAYGGLYGSKKLNLKAAASIGLQNFDITRNISLFGFNENPQSSFNTFSLKLSGQLEYKIGVDNEINLKPYISLENALIFNGEIKEKNAAETALLVESGQYLRSVAGAGLKLEDEKGDIKWYLKGYGGYALLGDIPEYKMRFANGYGQDMNIQGAKISVLAGAGAGIEYKASDMISIFANADLSLAENYYAYFANIGLSYKLGDIFLNRQEYEDLLRQSRAERAKFSDYKPIDVKTFRMLAAWFETAQYSLTPQAKEMIREAASEIKKYNYQKITIEGHADSTGRESFNKALSIMRARAVYEELYNNGIPLEKMEYIEFFGSEEAVAPNDTQSGRARNRRAELVIDYVMDSESLQRLRQYEQEEERNRIYMQEQGEGKKDGAVRGIIVPAENKIDIPQRQRVTYISQEPATQENIGVQNKTNRRQIKNVKTRDLVSEEAEKRTGFDIEIDMDEAVSVPIENTRPAPANVLNAPKSQGVQNSQNTRQRAADHNDERLKYIDVESFEIDLDADL